MDKLPRFTHLVALPAIAAGRACRCRCAAAEPASGPGPAAWTDDLSPIGAQDWSYDRAAHLLERAGFGGTPEEIQRARGDDPAAGGPASGPLPGRRQQRSCSPSITSGIFDPASIPSRPAAPPPPIEAKKTGRSAGRQGQAGRQPPHAAGGEQVLLLAAREPPRDRPRRLLVGRTAC